MKTKKVFIDAAHSEASPGLICLSRRECDDCESFAGLLKAQLDLYPFVKTLTARRELSAQQRVADAGREKADMYIAFHRACAEKMGAGNGISLTLPRNTDASGQYRAYRLLKSLADAFDMKYRGVHILTLRCPHQSLDKSSAKDSFLINLGFIDSERDNSRFERFSARAAALCAKTIIEIMKESDENDNNSFI